MLADGEKGERSPSGLAATSPSVRAFIYLYGRLRLIWRLFLRRKIGKPQFSQIRFNRSIESVRVLVCDGAKRRRSRIKDKHTHRCQKSIFSIKFILNSKQEMIYEI